MTKEQTQMIVGLIARAYPKQYANMTAQEKWEVVALYFDIFKDEDFGMMQTVVKKYIETEKFPPSIADLKSMIDKIGQSETEVDTVESCVAESWKAICGNLRYEQLSTPSQIYWGSQLAIDAVGYSDDAEYSVIRGQMQRRLPEIMRMLKDEKIVHDVHRQIGQNKELPIGFDEEGRIVKALKESE